MIDKSMILAAGLGTRMRPLTDSTPKPLIEINRKTLIDYKIDAARRAGIRSIVVNVHYLADQLENHLSHCKDPAIIISDERKQLMDSGGGIFKALSNFDDKAFLVMNSDTFWTGDRISNLSQMFDYWDANNMDILLALADKNKSVGFHGAGDFFMDEDRCLIKRGEMNSAPYAFAGDYIVHPRIFHNLPHSPFSSLVLFDRAIEKRRLHGIKLQGTWFHVGTPQSIKEAEKFMALQNT